MRSMHCDKCMDAQLDLFYVMVYVSYPKIPKKEGNLPMYDERTALPSVLSTLPQQNELRNCRLVLAETIQLLMQEI